MQEEIRQENKMGVMPVTKLIITMSLPIMASMLVQALYNIVDSIFVAQISEDALTGVSIVNPIQMLIIAVAVGSGVGINSLIARRLGAKNQKEADKAASTSIRIALFNYLLFLFIGIFLTGPFVSGYAEKGTAIYDSATTYLSIVLIGSLFINVQIILEKVLQSTGNMIGPMACAMTGAIVNIALDPILIFGMFGLPRLEVAGAALATVIGQFAGMTVGIIGGTGSSKSSLVQLIPRLYDVNEGSVSVGGIDVRSYDMDALRNQVSVVLQQNVLFSGTILDNLRWGDKNASEEECINACKMACADEFIQTFPDKYDTHIEQGGTNVSGGQKQRLCIARALLKKPKILILDDSTSAVDTATDAKIRKAFAEEIPNTTKIIIAQRINSVMDADKIIVIDDGKVVGEGKHSELLSSNEYYREIYYSQKDKEEC